MGMDADFNQFRMYDSFKIALDSIMDAFNSADLGNGFQFFLALLDNVPSIIWVALAFSFLAFVIRSLLNFLE